MMLFPQFEFKVKRVDRDASSAGPALLLHKPLGVLGRGSDCDYILVDTERILSRRHAEIEQIDGTVYWTDLGTNASQINGVSLLQGQRRPLRAGDQIHAGPFVFTLSMCTEKNIWERPIVPSDDLGDFQFLPGLHEKALGIDDLLRDDEPLPMPEIQTPLVAMRAPIGQAGKVLSRPFDAGAGDSGDLLRATLFGVRSALGLSPSFNLDAEHLVLLATLFRILLEGHQKLLASRRIVRAEMGATHTAIAAAANNPMKFAASCEALVAQLLLPARQGFLSAPDSLEHAVNDLFVHQQFSSELLGLFAAQLHQALHPKTIENEQASSGGLDLGFSIQKKARLWDEYCNRFDQLTGNPEAPFSVLLQEIVEQLNQSATRDRAWK